MYSLVNLQTRQPKQVAKKVARKVPKEVAKKVAKIKNESVNLDET